MKPTAASSVRTALRTALARAMRHRDRSATAVYRTALSAIDNAEAVPSAAEHRAGAVESSASGVGRTDVARRSLTREDEIGIVRQEMQDRRATADTLAAASPDAARKLRSEADLLQAVLDGLTGDD